MVPSASVRNTAVLLLTAIMVIGSSRCSASDSDQGYGPWVTFRNCGCGTSEEIGMEMRRRECVEPYHKVVNGKKEFGCFGATRQNAACPLRKCPIDGGFTDWTQWTACSVTSLKCGGGTSGRTRACTNPAPQHDGSPCSGAANESRPCNTKESEDCPKEIEAAEGGAAAAATGEAEADTGGVGAIVGGVVGALAGTACVGMAIYGGVRYYKMLQRNKMERMENAD